MACDPVQLTGNGPYIFRTLRHLDAAELFHGLHVCEIEQQGPRVVHPCGVRQELHVAFVLRHLFVHPVEITKHRLSADKVLPVHLQNNPEHPVGARMLRAEVDEKAILFFMRLEGIKQFFVTVGNWYMFFSKRVMIDLLMEEEIGQVRMAFEVDAEELMNLTFIPAGYGIDIRNRGRNGLLRVKLQRHFDPAQFPVRIEKIDQLEVVLIIDAKKIDDIELSPIKEIDDAQEVPCT